MHRGTEVGVALCTLVQRNSGVSCLLMCVYVCACAWGCQVFVPKMLEQGTPCTIITTGSKQGFTLPPGNLAYNVAKASVKVITEGDAYVRARAR